MGIESLSSAPSAKTTTDGAVPSCTRSARPPRSPNNIIIAPPLTFDNSNEVSGFGSDRKVGLHILDVLKDVKPGSDLSTFQVPPQFNVPKSNLQCISEQVYCCGQNLLEQCADGATPLDRFLAVVRFHISLIRPFPFAKSPYNPILGETHHVTWGDLSLLTEQVSHHPPVSALYATNPKKKIEVLQWNICRPRFSGSSVGVSIDGRRTLTLAKYGETYEMTSPKLNFRFLPSSLSEWSGDTIVRCLQTGFAATVTFKSSWFFSQGDGNNRVSGKITRITSSQRQTLFTLSGSWDQFVILEDKETRKQTLLYDGKAALSNLKTPIVTNQEGLSATESVVVWNRVTEGLYNQDWEMARDAKTDVEEEQRLLRKQRSKAGQSWNPKYFTQRVRGEWEWAFNGQPVPPAPITV